MDAVLGQHEPIPFPLVLVTGPAGADGATGSDGIVTIFNNIPGAPVATTTTAWETFTGMTSGAIIDLAVAGDSLIITSTFSTTVPDSALTRDVRMRIDGVIVGSAASFSYSFPDGIIKATFIIEAIVKSATSLYLDVTVIEESSTFQTSVYHFTEVIAVADVTSLSTVDSQGDSVVIGDLQCERLNIKLAKKT